MGRPRLAVTASTMLNVHVMKVKTSILALSLYLVTGNILSAAQPADFEFMLRGYCFAGTKKDDPNAIGGYGRSNNLPRSLGKGEKARMEEPYLEIVKEGITTFAGKYEGILVRLVNGGKTKLAIPASDSRIGMLQEALDADGKWREVEYLPGSWCGNSYHSVYLEPKHYWEFEVPKYSGPQRTKLRFKLALSDD